MAALQASGPITLQDLITFFGGGTKLTDFYRGGGLVPATRSTTTLVVNYGTYSAGQYQPFFGTPRFQYVIGGNVYWDETLISSSGNSAGLIPFFVTSPGSGFQYNRVTVGGDSNGIRRRSYNAFNSTTTVDINTGVPTSGAIKLTDFYGAVDG